MTTEYPYYHGRRHTQRPPESQGAIVPPCLALGAFGPGIKLLLTRFIRRLALRHRLTKLPRQARDIRHCTCGSTLTLTAAMGRLERVPLDWISLSPVTEVQDSEGQLRATHVLVRHGHRAASPAGALCGWCRCSVAFQPGAITRHLVLHYVLAILPFPTSSTQNLGAARFFAQTSDNYWSHTLPAGARRHEDNVMFRGRLHCPDIACSRYLRLDLDSTRGSC